MGAPVISRNAFTNFASIFSLTVVISLFSPGHRRPRERVAAINLRSNFNSRSNSTPAMFPAKEKRGRPSKRPRLTTMKKRPPCRAHGHAQQFV